MKTIITCITAFWLLSVNAQEINYVSAKSGLLVRTQPDKSSKKTGKLPFATKVQLLNKTGKSLRIVDNGETINGQWVQVKDTRTNKIGYVFSGYLVLKNPSTIREKAATKSKNYYLVTNQDFGPINSETLKSDLVTLFDKSQISETVVDSYEGIDILGTEISFKNSNNNITIQWYDDTNTPSRVTTNFQHSDWATSNGIKIESPMEEVQKWNKKVFSINGFEIDEYLAGLVNNWNSGSLEGLQIQFEVTNNVPVEDYQKIMGRDVFSDNEILHKAGLKVKEIALGFPKLSQEEKNKNSITYFINCVKTSDKEKIADMISYPLNRSKPIPSIKNKKEFLKRYTEVFDAELIALIINSDVKKDWMDFKEKEYTTLNHDVILSYGYRSIRSIHTISKKEKLIQKRLINEEKTQLHTSLRDFEKPELSITTEKLLIRIDELKNGMYRYASWKKGTSILTKPDIILENGEHQNYGTGGNYGYEFINEAYKYIIYVNVIGPREVPPFNLTIHKIADENEYGYTDPIKSIPAELLKKDEVH